MRLTPSLPKLAPIALCLAGSLSASAFAQSSLHPADAVNARPAQAQGYDGHGTTVVVIDSGGFATSSPGLQGKLVGEACFNIDMAPNICPNGQASQLGAGAATAPWPDSSHGTEIAELIVGSNAGAMGVAPGATIYAIRVGGLNGKVSPVSARDALSYVYSTVRNQFNVAAVVTPFVPDTAESGTDRCTEATYRYTVDVLRDAGIGVVMGAGDSGFTGALQFDGCRLEAVAVAAFNQGDVPSPTSNYSQNVAFGATAGPNLLTAAGDGSIKTIPDSSTAWAAGLSAGAFAILKTYRPNAHVDTMIAALQSGGKPIAIADPTPGSPLPHYTIRRIDVANALTFLTSDIVPEGGFWWNPSEGGRGYFVDVQGNAMFFGAFMYNGAGQPEWYVGRLTQTGNLTYAGALNLNGGGQPLGSTTYVPPSSLGTVATVQLSFVGDDTATLTIQAQDGQKVVAISRYRYFYDGNVFNPQRPQTGWYWDPTKPGSGVAFEVLGSSMFLVPFAYDASGHAQWTAAQGNSISTTQFLVSTQPVLYANGQTLTGPYVPPQAMGQPLGTITVQAMAPHVLSVVYNNGSSWVTYMPFRYLD